MKKLAVFFSVLLLLGTTFAVSQPVQGKKFELGTAFSFSSFKFSDSLESDTILTLPLRFGFFIWKGLEIEPEVMLQKWEGSDAAFLLSGNLAYNFKLQGNLVPFLLAGAGLGNGLAVGPFMEGGSGINAFLLNFGGGLKYVLGNSGAIRLEYRFSRNRLTQEGFEAEIFNSHQIFLGVSVFF